MKKAKYKVSVVIPIYNVYDYLEETIESVVNQTIGINNIQIILVNDGSPDNSEEICLKYKELFPNNIIYIKQENAGVSAARNNGINYVEGEIVNFLDSDDKWELNVFEKAYRMFEGNKDIDVIGVRQKTFEAQNNFTSLDFKFTKDKIVDIFNSYDHLQLSVSSAFIRTSSIGKLRFDIRVKYSEDAKFIIEIILKTGKLGIISSSMYLYRKRFSENSALQTKLYNEDWYLVTPKLCYQYLFNFSKEKFGYVLPYVQFYFVYDLQWRIREIIPNSISTKIINNYKTIIKELLQDVDDYIIMQQKNMFTEYKIKVLSMKYNEDITKKLNYINHKLYFHNIPLLNFEKNNFMKIETINFRNGKIDLRGFVNCYISKENFYVNLVVNKTNRYKIELNDTKIYMGSSFNERFITKYGFKIEIEEREVNNICFELVYNNYYVTRLDFSNGINSKLDCKTKVYYVYKNRIYYVYNKYIKSVSNTFLNRLRFCLRSTKNKIISKEFKVLTFRIVYTILKRFEKKKIWLISDRTMTANDNGIHLFKYIVNQNNRDIKPYFVVSKESSDYKKVKKIGRVLAYNSFKYKIYFLLSSKVISSQADSWVYNAFGKREMYYRDLYNFDFVFLQHGITMNNLSRWLNHYEKNIKLFVTSANDEYKSIVNGDYGYKEDVVKLTGFPRYDNLNSKPKKIISIMPTWRSSLSGENNKSSGIRNYNPNFKDSKYFKFYNNLINDEKLLNIMNKKGYKGIFVIHPSHKENYIDFESNDNFEIISDFADYQDIFKKSNLLVTDYSSVHFDFAYLYKPVIYAQFDRDEFFSNHIYESGYFDYSRDGFGPVLLDYDQTVNTIIKFIENDCRFDNKYLERVNNFYKYRDKNNCKRVYEEILKLDNNK